MKTKIKGRDYELNLARNKAILYRFYYYHKMQNMVKDKSLELIHKEFYLSKCRVQEIIYDNKEYLNEIIHRKPAVKWLDLEYPHVKWISPENTVNQ